MAGQHPSAHAISNQQVAVIAIRPFPSEKGAKTIYRVTTSPDIEAVPYASRTVVGSERLRRTVSDWVDLLIECERAGRAQEGQEP